VKRRRWLRFALPFAVVGALVTMTVVAHVVQQPDPTDASFLSPRSDAGDGARQLAERLGRDGVQVQVQATSAGVLAAAASGTAATVFVTTPELVHPYYLERLAGLPERVRVVLVAPDAAVLRSAGLDVAVGGPRWTAAAPQPGCAAEFATAAGPAAVLRWVYDAAEYQPVRCYADAVVEFRTGRAEVTLIGAADPFRNDRAGERGNAAFAAGLLARSPRVIWLDLHERERAPEPTRTPPRPLDPDATAEPDDDGYGEGDGEPAYPQEDPAGGSQEGEDGEAQGDGDSLTDSPLAQAFPPAVWATLALLLLAAIALAAASARRLGAPVAEPLPARVRAAETVRGLGGLYRRAGARSTSLRTLQAAARRRLAEHFGLPPESPVDVVADRVAEHTGQPAIEVRHMLGGGVEDSDEELTRAATALQDLVRHVTGQQTWQQASDEGNMT
jgi:hypothetical protein